MFYNSVKCFGIIKIPFLINNPLDSGGEYYFQIRTTGRLLGGLYFLLEIYMRDLELSLANLVLILFVLLFIACQTNIIPKRNS